MIGPSVSLNPEYVLFPKAYSALIGQMAQSVGIGLLFTAHARNEMSVIISEFELQIFLSICTVKGTVTMASVLL